jgi:hypothetical protein
MQQEARMKSGLGQFESLGRVPHVRLGAVIAVALAAAFVVWLVVGNGGHSSTAQSSAAIPTGAGTGPLAKSAEDLKSFAAAIGHPVYWAGARSDRTYELTQTNTGRVYIRYLPAGVQIGVKKQYLTVATYPYPHAFAALKALAQNRPGAIKLAHGGLALVDKAYPKSVHLAYPGSDYEVEVFSPSPGVSRQVVASGEVSTIR